MNNRLLKQEFFTSFMWKSAAVLLVIFLILVWRYNARQKYLEGIFVRFFPDSAAEKVTLIDGHYFAWIDWRANLIFSTDPETFQELVKGYEIIDNDKLRHSEFTVKNPSTVFYYKDISKEDRRCEECLIAWDERNRRAYLRAGNSKYIRVLAAKTDIAEGTVVDGDMIEMIDTTWTKLGQGAMLHDARKPVGQAAVRDIAKGEHIDYLMLETQEERKKRLEREKELSKIVVSDRITDTNARAAYKFTYSLKKAHKAFAYSRSGPWGYCSEEAGVGEARRCALEECNVHRKDGDAPCMIINTDGT